MNGGLTVMDMDERKAAVAEVARLRQVIREAWAALEDSLPIVATSMLFAELERR